MMTCTTLQDWDLLELEHGCIVDRNACIFCHVGIFRNGTFIIDQVRPLARPLPQALPALEEQRLNKPRPSSSGVRPFTDLWPRR